MFVGKRILNFGKLTRGMKFRLIIFITLLLVNVFILPLLLQFPWYVKEQGIHEGLNNWKWLIFQKPFAGPAVLLKEEQTRTVWYYFQPMVAAAVIGIFTQYGLTRRKRANKDIGGPDSVGQGQFGTARWQTEKEVEKNFFLWNTGKELPRCGVVLGARRHGSKFMSWLDTDDTHTLLIGATRSGKSRRVITPSIRAIARAGESMIIPDPKKELYTVNVGLLQEQGYNVVLLDFQDPAESNRWNLLNQVMARLQINDAAGAAKAAKQVAHMLTYQFQRPEEYKGDKVWPQSQKSLTTALALARYTNKPTKISKNNDLIVSVRATLGKTNFSDKEYCLGRGVASLSSNKLSIKLLNYYFKIIKDYLKEISSGTTFSQIARNDIASIYYPLPPLPEQKRIVNRVKSLLVKINEAKQLIAEASETFEKRRAAILAKAFRGELTAKWREQNQDVEPAEKLLERIKEEKAKQEQGNKGRRKKQEDLPPIDPPYELPEGWCWVRLIDIGDLQRGQSKHRPRNDEKLFDGPYPFIQTGDVACAADYITEHSKTLNEFGLKQSKLFPQGTVCITIAANIADTAILTYPCCFPDSVVGFQPNEKLITSEYVHYYISTIKHDLEHYAPATAQKNINLQVLSKVLVPLPPKKEMLQICDLIRNLLDKEIKASKLTDLEKNILNVTQSVLTKAFRGELGTNDPNEESDLELLKKIIAEKS